MFKSERPVLQLRLNAIEKGKVNKREWKKKKIAISREQTFLIKISWNMKPQNSLPQWLSRYILLSTRLWVELPDVKLAFQWGQNATPLLLCRSCTLNTHKWSKLIQRPPLWRLIAHKFFGDAKLFFFFKLNPVLSITAYHRGKCLHVGLTNTHDSKSKSYISIDNTFKAASLGPWPKCHACQARAILTFSLSFCKSEHSIKHASHLFCSYSLTSLLSSWPKHRFRPTP